jgi:signal transduction histidine kinase
VVNVDARAGDGRLHLVVRDDGVGGATVAHGSGLIGLSDRVQALGGTISVRSPAGEGTTLEIDLPATVPPAPDSRTGPAGGDGRSRPGSGVSAGSPAGAP